MRLLLTLSFVGTRYHGWQVQKNALTVQQVVQDAVERVFGRRLPLTGCSRTDSGVHARMYCCHTDCDALPVSVERLPDALNFYLPADIAVSACAEVPADFHARYSAASKTYHYVLHNARCRDPFFEERALHIKAPLALTAMREAAGHLIGRHDFIGFQSAGATISDVPDSTVRTLTCCELLTEGERVTLSVTADGFLYNMVRIIAGTLIEVGRGKLPADGLPGIIQSRERARAGPTAPAHGLYLMHVDY